MLSRIIRSRAFQVSFSLVASIGLLALTLSYLDWQQLDGVLRGLSWPWAGAMFAAFLGFQVFRTLRTEALIGGARRWHLFNTLCIQTFLNLILPFGLGDLALIYLIRTRHEVTSHLGTTTVVFARYIDVALLCACYLLALAFEWRNWPWEVLVVIGALGAGLLLVALGMLVLARWDWSARVGNLRFGAALRRHGELFRAALRTVLARHTLVPAVLFSAAMWTCMYFFFFAAIRALAFVIPAMSVLLLSVLLDLAAFLPVKGIASIGSHHASWYFALRILQIDSADAAVLGFGTHLLFTGSYLAVGLIPAVDAIWRRCLHIPRRAAGIPRP